MNKSISLLIISLLFISCETPKKSESANSYQDFPNEPSNEKKEEFQKTHTVTGEPYVSKKSIKKYKEDIDQEKLKNIVWKDLKNFKNFKIYMQTSKFNIWIDQMEDGTYRYASWSKSKTINQKPDLILENGEVTYEGSARNHWYTFKNTDTKYICDINVLGKTSDDAFLIVKQGEKIVLDQSAKFLSPFTKFIPKNNVNFFLENLYSNEVYSLFYFNDKYIFTENIQNSVPLLIKTNNINDLSYIYEFPGLYESHQYDNGGKNNWHYVTIKTMKEGNGFIWENKAGVSWSLWPTTNPKVFQVAEDCPYFDVYQSVEFELDSKNNVLGIRANNEFYSVEEKIIDPGKALDRVAKLLLELLESEDGLVSDGMDLALCVWNKKTNELKFSGANQPFYLIRNGELNITKPNKQPIGYFEDKTSFNTHSFQLTKGDQIILFSDGYKDQFGGAKGKKFGIRRFNNVLLKYCSKTLHDQKNALHQEINNWMENEDQVDDICIFSIKV